MVSDPVDGDVTAGPTGPALGASRPDVPVAPVPDATSTAPCGDSEWRRSASWIALIAAVVVPLVVFRGAEDIFSGPKVTVLWVLLIFAWWLVAMDLLLGGTGRPPRPRLVRSVDLPLAGLLVASLVALLLSVDRNQSIVGERLQHQGVLTLGLYVGWFALARVLFAGRRGLERLMTAVVTGSAIVAALAIAQRAGLDPLWNGFLPGDRVFATIGQPNALAAYFALTFPCAAALAVGRRGAPRTLSVAAAVLIALAVLPTLSRGGYLGLATAMIAFGIGLHVTARHTWRFDRRTGGAVAAIAAAAVVLAVLPWSRYAALQSWDRVATMSEAGADESIAAHLDQWRVAVEIVADRPLVGTGPATYPVVFPIYSRLALPPDRVAYFDQYRVESAHNAVLDLAAGGGLPVVSAWVLTIAAIARRLWVVARRTVDARLSVVLVGVLAGMAGHLVANSLMTAEVTGSFVLWLLMGAAVGVASVPEHLDDADDEDPGSTPAVESADESAPPSERRASP